LNRRLGCVTFRLYLLNILGRLEVFTQSLQFLVRFTSPLKWEEYIKLVINAYFWWRPSCAMRNGGSGCNKRSFEHVALVSIRSSINLTVKFGGDVLLWWHVPSLLFGGLKSSFFCLVAG
jgi:hypothetical protein